MRDAPRITIVTPSFNQADFIGQTIESVLDQRYPNLEYFVIDGGSDDGSVNVIRRYQQHLNYWVSEPDAGQSDALVKGFARASGDMMNWTNSDDLLLDGALAKVADAYLAQDKPDFVIGATLNFQDTPTNVVRHVMPRNFNWRSLLDLEYGDFLHHQPSTFFSRDAYLQAGGIDPALHYVMDIDLYCRMLLREDVRVCYFEHALAAFRVHPQAKTATSGRHFDVETCRMVEKYSPPELRAQWSAGARRTVAKWALHRAATHWREGQLGRAGKDLAAALYEAPGTAVGYALGRMLRRMRDGAQ